MRRIAQSPRKRNELDAGNSAEQHVSPSLLPRLVGYAEVARALGVSRRTVERIVRRGELPAPFRVSTGCTRWRADTIDVSTPEQNCIGGPEQ